MNSWLRSEQNWQANLNSEANFLIDSETETPRLSKLAGVDKELFANRKPSVELDNMRKEWTEEFDKEAGKHRLQSSRKGRI